METINFNLPFYGCLLDFFKNCLSNPLLWKFSEIENFVCKYYGTNKTEDNFYNRMAFLYDCFYNNKEEFKNEVKKIKEFTEWQLF